MSRENKLMLKNVLITVLSIILLISIGVACYVTIVNAFGIEIKNDKSSMEKKVIVSNVLMDRKVCNAIYSIDEKNGVIEDIILEFFDSESGKIDYVTIPGNTKLNISKELIKQFKGYGYEVENFVAVRKLIKLFGAKDAYQYGQLILEDSLEIKISYYTVFHNNILSKYFVDSKSSFYVPTIGLMHKYEYDIYELSESYMTKCDQIENDISTLIKKGYEDIQTNFTLNNRLSYVKDYEGADINKVYTWHVVGKEQYNQFIIDKEKNAKLFEYILNTKKQYEETQDEYNQKLDIVNAMK